MMWRIWSDAVQELIEEVKAQARRFALSHLADDDDARVLAIDDPDEPGHLTFILEQAGEALVLIDVSASHVLEEAATIGARPGLIMEAVRRTARVVFFDAHLVNPVLAALARAS